MLLEFRSPVWLRYNALRGTLVACPPPDVWEQVILTQLKYPRISQIFRTFQNALCNLCSSYWKRNGARRAGTERKFGQLLDAILVVHVNVASKTT
jgi:hypothetical protein